MVAFVAVEVGADGDPRLVGTDGEDAHREEVAVAGLDVLVEDDLLAAKVVEGSIIGWREVIAARGYAHADGVVQAFACALEVPPLAFSHRHRDVGLFDAILDLEEEFVLEGLEGRELVGEVVVLGA